MTWLETFRSGFEAILAHRLRSALTVLGILIGIAAVINTVGLGEGATASVNSAISALGSNVLTVQPGSTTTSGVRGGFGSASTLTYSDALALGNKADCPDIAAVAPTVQRSTTVIAGNENWTTTVYGSTPSWMTVRNRSLAVGTFLTQAQLQANADVAVLGSTTAQELGVRFIGTTVTIDNIPFTVEGILASVGSSSAAANEDDEVVVPITTAQNQLLGSTTVNDIYLSARSQGTLGSAYQEAESELLQLHDITTPANADFSITSPTSILSSRTSADRALTFLLAGIAGLSLLVGGIGVMNIMLVSVTERVREIGLRKALGATPSVIQRQFLVEASTLGLVGGLVGAALGIGAALLITHLSTQHIAISGPAVAGSIAISIVIGVGFGVYPASRAAALTPIDALRSE
jgi:putative ABC transport system permease protein